VRVRPTLISFSQSDVLPYQAETINWPLKKRSGTRNRRKQLASAEDRTPATHTCSSTPVEGEVDEEESAEVAAVAEVVLTCDWWISTLKPSPDAPPGDKIFLLFSVPTSLLPVLDGDRDTIMVAPERRPP
jgi:hypothetical protein